MAEVLDEFPGRKFGKGRRQIYPWNDWLDGRVWRLTRGTDFKSETKSFASTAAVAADRRGLKLRTTRPDADTVVIQAYRVEAEDSAPAERGAGG